VARLTVAIPTRNRFEWRVGAIESALCQSFGVFELVVCDNASTDATPDVVAGFRDERVRYVRRPRDVGITETHNLIFRSIQSEYFLVLPDDDRIKPDLLERTVPVLDAHPRAGMVHTAFDTIDRDGRVVVRGGNWTNDLARDAVEDGRDFIRRSMYFSCRVCASTALTRTAALPPDLYDPADFPAVDFGLWLRMALDWDMAFLIDSLAEYRIHGESHSAAPGVGEALNDGYIQGFVLIDRLLELKLRFLAAHAERFPDRDDLERLAAAGRRRELLNTARLSTLPARELRTTARVVARIARHEPRMLADRGTLRLLAASVIGRRTVERIQRIGVAG
jgi:glycosyltransferase involved in cell wall biosynthesis